MKKASMIVLACSAFVTAACTSNSTNIPSSAISTQTVAHMQANLNVGEKISGNCSITKFLFFTFGDTGKSASGVFFDDRHQTPWPFSVVEGSDTTKKCASAAAYDAVINNDADIIYAPQYTAETWDFGLPFLYETTDVKVTGFKATVRDFTQLDSQHLVYWQLTGKR